jgi:transposase
MNTPLLLSAPSRIIRDAARAVKRKAGLMIERVTAGTLSALLGLPGMVVTEYALESRAGEREVLHLFCQHEHDVAVCPSCGQVSSAVHDSTERCIRHLDIWGKVTFVHFPARRFDCGPCHKPFTEELSWIESQRRESTAYELHIYEQCQHTPHAAVAEREGLHAETVKTIFQRWAKRAKRERQGLVRCLGVDEIALHKGHQHFAMVLSDLDRHCVIAVLAERSQAAFEQWLDGLSEAERRAIRVVAMDMWGPYRGVVKAKLAHAEIVADRFHVTKQLNEALAKIRCTLQAAAAPTAYELLKGTRWILVRTRAELKPEEEAKLQAVLAAFPELRKAYVLKEQFRTLADKIHDRPRAERFLRAWLYEAETAGLPQLVKFAKTLRHWWDEFLNYFNEGFSSGVVEGLNNAIRAIIRRAFGYHVFEHFRLQVLVEQGQLTVPPPPI